MGDNMKQITFLVLHLGYGGIETSTINTANALSKKYKIKLISFYNLDNNQTNLLNKNIEVKYLCNCGPNKKELKEAIKKINLISIFREVFKAIKLLINKRRLLKKEIINDNSYALISTRVEFSVILSKYGKNNSLKIAQEHHHHNDNKKYINKLKRKYNRIDYLFSLTSTLKDDYEKFLCKNTHTKVVIIPNMLEKEVSKKSLLKEKNIISVGRLHEGKRIDDLIRIFSKIDNKNSKLFIIGSGEEEEKLKKLIKELKLSKRVVMTGYLNKEQQEEYFLNSCVFAMTSISEGLPMVLLESMQYGVPCIAYETESGVKDIIDNDKNGYIISNRDENEYIKKLNKILSEEEILKKFHKSAIKKSEMYSSENIVKEWEKVLDGK